MVPQASGPAVGAQSRTECSGYSYQILRSHYPWGDTLATPPSSVLGKFLWRTEFFTWFIFLLEIFFGQATSGDGWRPQSHPFCFRSQGSRLCSWIWVLKHTTHAARLQVIRGFGGDSPATFSIHLGNNGFNTTWLPPVKVGVTTLTSQILGNCARIDAPSNLAVFSAFRMLGANTPRTTPKKKSSKHKRCE